MRSGGMSIKYQELTPATYTVVRTEELEIQPTGTALSTDPNIISGTYTSSQLFSFSTLPSTLNSSLTYYLEITGDTTTYTSWVITKSTEDFTEYVQYRLMAGITYREKPTEANLYFLNRITDKYGEDTVEQVMRRYKGSEFKRKPIPVRIKLEGIDREEPKKEDMLKHIEN